ncbi:MAG TPA: DUF4105 domain-containing protein [Gemmatimonadaceae bacterium]
MRAVLLLTVFASTTAAAQSSVPQQAPAEDGSALTVYLLTMGQGDEVWERFGHNAIWIHDATRSTDIAYNWGLFDFNDADFYRRFAGGDMRYWMGGFDFAQTVAFYSQANRSVYSQELDLTPAQRLELRSFVEWNALPENRYYSYDYFRDNCSTRVRDALDRALGGAIKTATDSIITNTTYRSHTRRLIENDPLMYTGINFGLGEPTDRRISVWEEMFLPMRMRESLRSVRVSRPGGELVALVKGERELFRSTRPPEPKVPTNHVVLFSVIGIAVAVLLVLLGGVFRTGASPKAFAFVAGIWSVVVGIAGTGLAALWLFTRHVYSYRNENLLQANSLSLVLAIAIFATITRDRRRRTLTSRIALTVAGLSLVGLIVQVLPTFNQVNGEIIGLLLPVHIAIGFVLYRRYRQFNEARAVQREESAR